ncbi:MAG: glutamine-hydrolyzing carbamoyl-phosphate synthase small subunit [Actinomycetota bacterium]|jgi:carbamoyl-phosphate synthase small subunit
MTRNIRPALLVLQDGSVFEGEAIGANSSEISAPVVARGEVVFHTGLSGYQEILTDPSYAGQIITFTTPHIGNYGTSSADNESSKIFARGVIVRELARRRSNWRSDDSLDSFLKRHDISGIAGIDTRRLTRVLRDSGAMPGAFGTASESELRQAAAKEKGTAGRNLIAQVTTTKSYVHGAGKFKVVAFDFGIKTTILNCLAEFATVHVVPASTSAAEVMALSPDGIFLSNGPGDPEMVHGAPATIRELFGTGVPMFGICLGHQLMALALGGKTFKLPFGHHGANHPVRNLATNTVEITSQNHNFCVDADSLAGKAEVTHVNLNDNTNEGMRVLGANAFSVQYHPEAGPGPHDSRYLFGEFVSRMEAK